MDTTPLNNVVNSKQDYLTQLAAHPLSRSRYSNTTVMCDTLIEQSQVTL